jgi:hypothetical protein
MLDALELQEQFVGMTIGPTAEFSAVVGEHGLDRDAVRFEARQDIRVEQVDGSDQHLVGVEAAPAVAQAAVVNRVNPAGE